MQNRDR